MTKEKIRTRIAPSPTGSPHIGTIYTALFNYCFAKKSGGEFILRIEDTDRTRFVENSEKEIIEALNWVGLPPDEGPVEGGKYGPYRQSERLAVYQEQAKKLVESGKAYYCDCSQERLQKVREEQQVRKEIPHYDRKCRYDPPKNLKSSVIRLAVPVDGETVVDDEIRGEVKFQNKILDDQVLLKSDGFPTYHLASVVDDHLMEISHVIRAEEWLSSTPKHILLYHSFGWKPPKFVHLPLLRNRDHSKISKRKNPVAVTFYKDEGYLPEALINFLGLMGWSMPDEREIFSLEEMIENFDLGRIDVAGPIFDLEKLDWVNGYYIRSLSEANLAKQIKPFSRYSLDKIKKILPLIKERLKKLSDFDSMVHYFFEDNIELAESLLVQKGKSAKETKEILEEIKDTLEKVKLWKKSDLEKVLSSEQEKSSWSRTDLFQTIRAAVTGSKASPPLFETLGQIGRKKTLIHLTQAIRKLS